MLVVNDTISIPLAELDFEFSRSSGPGGQNVNKVNTKVTLQWPVRESPSLPDGVRERFVAKYRTRINNRGQLVIHSQRFRNRGRNVSDCLSKLREMVLSVAEPPKKRKRTRPSRASRERRLNDKKQRSQKKQSRQTARRRARGDVD